MYIVLASLAAIFFVLLFTELLWRKKIIKPELARKTVHILTGLIIASWPFYIDFTVIVLLATLMLVVVAVSKKLRIFSSIHSVKRKTWGELFFAAGIIATAVITNSPWIFAAAILHVSLADGLAGLVGSGLKKPLKYFVFKNAKSVQGTIVFVALSAGIFAAAIYYDSVDIPDIALPVILLFSLTIALIENASPYGSDDLIVPVSVAVLLETLRTIT